VKQQIVFLDFEASGLFGRSWPIEAGYASSCGKEDSFLLARHADWSLEDWDRKSAQIHGISLEDLAAEGLAAKVALARLEEGIGDAIVVSDAPAFDNYWLDRLAEAAGRPARFVVRDWNEVLPTAQSEADREAIVARARAAERHLHRAGPDSRVMRNVWAMSWEKEDAEWMA
jgi:DNA polymerase III subunit epsilon